MGIVVKCPNGHKFKVKDKYAGKKGLCPHCDGQVLVRVPDGKATQDFKTAVHRAAAVDRAASSQNKKQGNTQAGKASEAGEKIVPVMPQLQDDSASIFDDTLTQDSGTSGSLLGSSIIRHNVKCPCGESVPMWFARCPKCGEYMPQR